MSILKALIGFILATSTPILAPNVQLNEPEKISNTFLTAIPNLDFEFPEYATTTEATTTAESLFATTTVATTTPKVKKIYCPTHLDSCVMHARSISPYQPPRVARAADIPVIRFEAKVGAWVLFKPGKVYGKDGHAGVVIAMTEDTITVDEANLKRCARTVRTISKSDPDIRGYFWTGWEN